MLTAERERERVYCDVLTNFSIQKKTDEKKFKNKKQNFLKFFVK